jgi:hypothetical protein
MLRLRTAVILIIAMAIGVPSFAQSKDKRKMGTAVKKTAPAPAWIKSSQTKLENELVKKYGESQRARAQRGLKQAASFWRTEDGDQAAFEEFVTTNFAGDQKALDTMFNRY